MINVRDIVSNEKKKRKNFSFPKEGILFNFMQRGNVLQQSSLVHSVSQLFAITERRCSYGIFKHL
jgi:hypothetical protein